MGPASGGPRSGTGGGGEAESPLRRWLAVALACIALLALPLLGWLLIPVPHAVLLSRAAPGERAAVTSIGPKQAASARPMTTARAVPAAPSALGAVSGVVLDPDGQPMAEAFVECVGGSSGATSRVSRTTDAAGRFELPLESAGCRATAHHPTLEPSDEIALVAGPSNVLRLARSGGITGLVVDEAGSPVTSYFLGVESFIAKDGESEVSAGGRMKRVESPGGTFELQGLYAGRYVLSAAAQGLPPAESDGVDVERGRTTAYVRIVLARGAILSGVVTDAATRKPVAGARVALDAFSGVGFAANRGAAPTMTDAAGAFSLSGVPRGLCSVRVDAPGYRQKIVSGLDARGGRTLRADIALTVLGDGGASSELTGIGAMLAPSPKGVMVAGIVPGGPAEKGGLKRGDRFTRIGRDSATDLTVSDAIQRLRGPEGTRVRVVVTRDGSGPVEVELVRDVIVR